MVMFDPKHMTRLIKSGEKDADRQTGGLMEWELCF